MCRQRCQRKLTHIIVEQMKQHKDGSRDNQPSKNEKESRRFFNATIINRLCKKE